MYRFSRIVGASVIGLALASVFPQGGALAAKFTVLHTFTGGSDGGDPYAGLIMDAAGNVYGTTGSGGASGNGTVFEVTPAGTETVLYSFAGGTDGAAPEGSLIRDGAGNFYGTTVAGGTSGFGTVFKLTPGGTESVLYSFAGGSDGRAPHGGLVEDSSGNIYGTTYFGGSTGCSGGWGCGTAFEITSGGAESVLHSFGGSGDGNGPQGSLIMDNAGNLYGTTFYGGPNGGGNIYKIAPGGAETVLYNFCSMPDCADGNSPAASLIADSAGNFYGTTTLGGTNCSAFSGCGTVFELTAGGTESVLYSFDGDFAGTENGWLPWGSLYRDSAGNLYGTTITGGKGKCLTSNGCGVVFQLAPGGTETVLKVLTRGKGGAPYAGLIADTHGYLYGTTFDGGAFGRGAVIKVKE